MKLTKTSPFILARIVLSLLFVSQFALSARAEILPIKNYTSADGLIYEEVHRIYQDSRGFIWITTPVGVSRFDGYQFTSYGFEDGLYNTLITAMVEDANGVYWFGTMNGVVFRFDPRKSLSNEVSKPKRFDDYKIGDDDTYVNAILKTTSGEIYFATWKGLFTLDDARAADDKFVPVEIDAEKNKLNFTSLAQDTAGNLWIGCQNGLLRRLPSGEFIDYAVEPNDAGSDLVRDLAVDATDRIWINSEKRHLFVFNPEPAGSLNLADKAKRNFRFNKTDKLAANLAPGYAYRFTSEENPGDGVIKAICSTANGKIWLAAYKKGLISFDGREFRLYTKPNGLNNDMLTALREDSFGNLWIGSEGGVMRLSRKGFVTYNEDSGLSDERIVKVFEDRRDGTIYATNPSWTVNRFDGRKFDAIKLNIPDEPKRWVLTNKILLDGAGDWWFASTKGLYRYSGVEKLEQINQVKPSHVYTTKDGLPTDAVFSMAEDSRGNVWMSDAEKGDFITVWNRATDEFHSYTKADGIPEKCFARHFKEDAAGNMYVACDEQYILLFRDGKFRAYHSENLPAGWWIGDILIDRRGILWVATPTKGLLRIKNLASGNPIEKAYTTADGLSSIHTQFLAEDLKGNIYFVTSRAMDVIEPETGNIKQYTIADGLASAGTGAAIRDRNGDIWIGVHRGVSRFTPESGDAPLFPPPVFIGNLRVAGKQVPLSALGETNVSEMTLEPEQRDVQIDFYGLNLTSGDALRYQYKLEGADKDWSDLTTQRSVNLNLASGAYKFLVRAVTLEGATSATPATVSFNVLRPIWQRWWFLTLAALAIGFFIYALYRYRLRRLLELERVRTRIATDLHDDIGSSLSQIAILSEVVRQKITDASANQPLNMIAETSREMVDSMSDIVWAINPDKDHFSDLVQRMRRFASDVLEAQNITYQFQSDEKHRDFVLGADIRREVYLIFKESINNLVKHAAAKTVEMSAQIEDNQLVVKIRDDGRGFDSKENSNGNYEGFGGNGLINMRRRAASLGGQFEIESRNAAGTSVTIKIPLKEKAVFGFTT